MKYLTKRSCERAIERKVRRLRPRGFSLAPAEDGRRWKIGVIFPVVTRAQVVGYELGLIRQIVKNAKYRYEDDDRGVEEVKAYWDEALHAAIVALEEIETVFRSGEAEENSEFGIRNSESDPSTPLRSAQDDTEESEDKE